jgi:glycosyltransferase 2 family protein
VPTISKGSLSAVVRVTLSICLVAVLVYRIGSGEIIKHLGATSWDAIGGAVFVLATSSFFVTPRWAVILYILGYPIAWTALIGSVFLGFLFNQMLPTGVGGDVLRIWRARTLGAPLVLAIHSVLLDRAAGVVVSLIGATILFPFVHPESGKSGLGWILGVAGSASIVGCAILLIVADARIFMLPFIGKLQGMLVAFAASITAFLHRPAAGSWVFLFSCLNQSLPVLAILFLARDLGVHLGILDIAFVTFFSTLAATIPISFGGWGVREGALVYLFGLYNVAPQVAFAISILYGASVTLSSTPAILLLFRGNLRGAAD